MSKTYFITGIGTEVGKTVVSAVITEALQADYWKPIQSGDLAFSDTDKVKEFISNSKSKFHPNSYALTQPLSPHISAAIDGAVISLEDIQMPNTDNTLVIEGAGGLLVPLNAKGEFVADIIAKNVHVVLVTKHYLGSINHTLLSLNELQNRGFDKVILVINGHPNPSTESIIENHPIVSKIWRIDELETVTMEQISKEAKRWRKEYFT